MFWNKTQKPSGADKNEVSIFCFHEDLGPLGFYYNWFDFGITLENSIYSCKWSVGWDSENTFLLKGIKEEYVIDFLKKVKASVVSTWNGFNDSKDVLDAYSVSLEAKCRKAGIDLKMHGRACRPRNFDKGADFIVKEYDRMLKRAGESLESKEITEYYIVRVENNFSTLLREPRTTIGRNVPGMFPMRSNNSISREHADIIMRDERFFILDRNSRSKTYVKGAPIPSETEVELTIGEPFQLSNEDFVVASVKRPLFYHALHRKINNVEQKCPNCGTDIGASARYFCICCGAKLE